MTDTNNPRHPSTMTEEEKKALIASDPSAFEDADTTGDDANATGADAGDADGGEKDQGNKDVDGAAAAAAATNGAGKGAAAAATDDPAAKRTSETVPAARLAEVVAQRNSAEDLARTQAAELQALRARLSETEAKPPKDFDAEFAEIQRKYNAGELDEGEKDQAIRKLSREEARHEATIVALKTQHQTTTAAVTRSWDEEVAAWSKANPGFLAGDGNSAIFDRALAAVQTLHGEGISNQKLLAEASKLAFEMTGYQPPAGAEGTTGADDPKAGAARRQQNAQASAAASSQPAAITGGVGGRGGPGKDIDVKAMKPGTFSKMSRADQERLLGEGAV